MLQYVGDRRPAAWAGWEEQLLYADDEQKYERLTTLLYLRDNPARVGAVRDLMDKYRGKEHEMFRKLCRKYCPFARVADPWPRGDDAAPALAETAEWDTAAADLRWAAEDPGAASQGMAATQRELALHGQEELRRRLPRRHGFRRLRRPRRHDARRLRGPRRPGMR